MSGDWIEARRRAEERYADGERRLPESGDERQRQLTRMGNAAGAAGLAALMAGGDGREWFARAAERYRESWPEAPPGSWGRPIGAIKARILAGDWEGAEADARWALEAGAAEAESPIGRYAAALACLVLGEWDDARVHADYVARADEELPVGRRPTRSRSSPPRTSSATSRRSSGVLESFETRDAYLEDLPVADTVLVLQALAARRGMSAELSSPLLPA